jgi:hypothetical protein
VLLERLGRDVEALGELGGGDQSLAVLAAAIEEVGEQRLEEAEALGRDRARRALLGVGLRLLDLGGKLGRLRLVSLLDALEIGAHDLPELGRRERHRAAVLPEDPGREQPQVRVFRNEDAVLDASVLAELALDPPGRVAGDLDLGVALDRADLPWRAQAVLVRVEVLREAEIALAPGREPDVIANPGDAKGAHVVLVGVVADHVPLSAVEEERVRVDCALSLAAAPDGEILELDRAVLGDRPLELRQPAGELGRVAGVVQLDGPCGLGRRLLEARPA